MNDKAITPFNRFKSIITSSDVKSRFDMMLGERAGQFLGSLLSVVASDSKLVNCDPYSVLNAAAKAAALDLPVDPNLGLAYIIPYGRVATFQPGYRAYVQLCLRTEKYEVINVTEIYEGETIHENRLTGEITLVGTATSNVVQGYAAYFRMKDGFEKAVYWPKEKVLAHASKFAPTWDKQKKAFYDNSAWKTNFDEMAKKTVLKHLLNHYGRMTVGDREMLRQLDEADEVVEEEVVDTSFVPVDEPEEPPFVPDPEPEPAPPVEVKEEKEVSVEQYLVDAHVCESVAQAASWLKNKKSDIAPVVWAKMVRGWLDSGLANGIGQAIKMANEGKKP